MVLRVKRALAKALMDNAITYHGMGRDELASTPLSGWDIDTEKVARAIIDSMREPTAAMIEAVPYDMYDPDFAANWRTMIRVALGEPFKP